jgi:hypothetical protein
VVSITLEVGRAFQEQRQPLVDLVSHSECRIQSELGSLDLIVNEYDMGMAYFGRLEDLGESQDTIAH